MADRTSYSCSECGAEPTTDEAIRRRTLADLDPDKWQTLCCPDCGVRLETIFVGGEDA